jgi:hypothetical protein
MLVITNQKSDTNMTLGSTSHGALTPHLSKRTTCTCLGYKLHGTDVLILASSRLKASFKEFS